MENEKFMSDRTFPENAHISVFLPPSRANNLCFLGSDRQPSKLSERKIMVAKAAVFAVLGIGLFLTDCISPGIPMVPLVRKDTFYIAGHDS